MSVMEGFYKAQKQGQDFRARERKEKEQIKQEDVSKIKEALGKAHMTRGSESSMRALSDQLTKTNGSETKVWIDREGEVNYSEGGKRQIMGDLDKFLRQAVVGLEYQTQGVKEVESQRRVSESDQKNKSRSKYTIETDDARAENKAGLMDKKSRINESADHRKADIRENQDNRKFTQSSALQKQRYNESSSLNAQKSASRIREANAKFSNSSKLQAQRYSNQKSLTRERFKNSKVLKSLSSTSKTNKTSKRELKSKQKAYTDFGSKLESAFVGGDAENVMPRPSVIQELANVSGLSYLEQKKHLAQQGFEDIPNKKGLTPNEIEEIYDAYDMPKYKSMALGFSKKPTEAKPSLTKVTVPKRFKGMSPANYQKLVKAADKRGVTPEQVLEALKRKKARANNE